MNDVVLNGLNSLPEDIQEYAVNIAASWRKSTEAIIETAMLLKEADDKLTQSQSIALRDYLGAEAGISASVISKLKSIARNPVLIDPTYRDRLPPSYATLYQISKIDRQELVTALDGGAIKATTELKDITAQFGSLTKKPKKKDEKPFSTLKITFTGDIEDISLENIDRLQEALNAIRDTKMVKVVKSGGI